MATKAKKSQAEWSGSNYKNKKNRSVYLEESLSDTIDKLAEADGRTFSNYMEKLAQAAADAAKKAR